MKNSPVVERSWIAGLAFVLVAGSIASASAMPVLTGDDAAATVLASGFARVAKAEAAPNQGLQKDPSMPRAWSVWASKDGIAYVITIDAGTGQVLVATPAVADD